MNRLTFNNFSDIDMSTDTVFRDCVPLSNESESSSYVDLPVYRSISVLEQPQLIRSSLHQGELQRDVLEMPKLSENVSPKSCSSSEERDSLFSLLDTYSDFVTPGVMPTVDDLGFNPLASTNMLIEKSVDDVIQFVNSSLVAAGVFSEYDSDMFRWCCEVEKEYEAVKFEIQLFSATGGVIVEFLKLSGCSRIFSQLYRSFTSSSADSVVEKAVPSTVAADVTDSDVDALISWMAADPVEATKSVCVLVAMSYAQAQQLESTIQVLLTKACYVLTAHPDLSISGAPILSMIGTLHPLYAQSQQNPLCLDCIDKLIPSVVRLACSNSVSTYTKSRSQEVIEQRWSI